MGVDARAMISGAFPPVRLAALVGQVAGGEASLLDRGEGFFTLSVAVPGVRWPRLVSFMHDDESYLDVMQGMRTLVTTRSEPLNLSILRSVVSRTGGLLLPRDDVHPWEWERFEAAGPAEVALTPDQELAEAIRGMAEGDVANAVASFCADPGRRAMLEAALAARREAEAPHPAP